MTSKTAIMRARVRVAFELKAADVESVTIHGPFIVSRPNAAAKWTARTLPNPS